MSATSPSRRTATQACAIALSALALVIAPAANAQQSATIDTTAQLSVARPLGSISPVQEVRFGEVAIPRNTTASQESCTYSANPAQPPVASGGQSVTSLGCERLSGVPQMGQMKIACSSSNFVISATSSTNVAGLGTEMALEANVVNAIHIGGEAFGARDISATQFKCGSDIVVQLNPVLRVTESAKATGSVVTVGTVTLNVVFL